MGVCTNIHSQFVAYCLLIDPICTILMLLFCCSKPKLFHKAFEVWVGKSDDPNGTAQKITEFEDELPVGAISDDTYYLFVKMKETADNTFQNTSYSGIGITVYAVQGNADIGRIKE